jgi:hypothetical protein
MVATLRRGPIGFEPTREPLLDGTTCQQLSPLQGPVGTAVDRLRAARGGTPFRDSPRHTLRAALGLRRTQINDAIRQARTPEELMCLSAQWAAIKADYESLLGEPLKYEREAGGDEAVISVLKDIFDPNLIGSLAFDIVSEALVLERINVDKALIDAVSDEIRGWLEDMLSDILWSMASGLLDDRIRRPKRKQIDSLGSLLKRAADRVGVKLTAHQSRALVRRLMDEVRSPVKLGRRIVKRVGKIYGSAAVVALRVFLTPSKTASRRLVEDANPAISDEIERSLQDALNGMIERDLTGIALPSASRGPQLHGK